MKISSTPKTTSLRNLYICLFFLTGTSMAIANPSITMSETNKAGTYKIEVKTGDLPNIKRVKLYVNGSQVGYQDTSKPYTWQWNGKSYGGNSISVRGLAFNDKIGRTYETETVLNLSGGNQSSEQGPGTSVPKVSLKAPSGQVSGSVKFNVEASDPQGIENVKLYAGNVLVGTDKSKPYEFKWNSSPYAGSSVTIEAVASDKIGNSKTDAININVKPDNGGSSGSGSNAKLLFTSNFETGAIQGKTQNPDGWGKIDDGLNKAISVERGFARSGRYSAKLSIDKKDWSRNGPKPRAQLNKTNQVVPIYPETEYWMGVSTFIPKDWKEEKNTANSDLIWQFHGSSGGPGQGVVPPLSLDVRGNKFYIQNRYGKRSDVKARNLYVGKLEKGRWIDWVVRVKFSLDRGYISIWKDGVKVGEVSGVQTIYPGSDPSKKNKPLYTTLSIYKPKWLTKSSVVNSRTVYFDEFRLAEGKDGRSLVSPR